MRVTIFIHKCFESVVPFWTVLAHLTSCLCGGGTEPHLVETHDLNVNIQAPPSNQNSLNRIIVVITSCDEQQYTGTDE